VKYEDVTLMASGIRTKNVKIYEHIQYPRLDESDSLYQSRGATEIRCVLAVMSWGDFLALKALSLTHAEEILYVDQTGTDSHYYKRVNLELGDEERLKNGVGWLIPAVFTALDPYLYDAATDEVVY